MNTIYRLELKWYDVFYGIYQAKHYRNALGEKNAAIMSAIRDSHAALPEGFEDFDLSEILDNIVQFAFPNYQAAKKWFGKDWKTVINMRGVVVKELRVRESLTGKSGLQCVYKATVNNVVEERIIPSHLLS